MASKIAKLNDGNVLTHTSKVLDGTPNKKANKGSITNIAKPVNTPKSGK